VKTSSSAHTLTARRSESDVDLLVYAGVGLINRLFAFVAFERPFSFDLTVRTPQANRARAAATMFRAKIVEKETYMKRRRHVGQSRGGLEGDADGGKRTACRTRHAPLPAAAESNLKARLQEKVSSCQGAMTCKTCSICLPFDGTLRVRRSLGRDSLAVEYRTWHACTMPT